MDKYDKSIILYLDSGGLMCLTDLVEHIFDVTNAHVMKKRSNCLRYRLERMIAGEIVEFNRKTKLYSLTGHDVGTGLIILTKSDGNQLGLDTGNTVFFHLPGGGDRVVFLDGDLDGGN